MFSIRIVSKFFILSVLSFGFGENSFSEEDRPTFRPTTFMFKSEAERDYVLHLYNGHSFSVSWSLEPFSWSQGDDPKLGNDILTPTGDIVIETNYIFLNPGEEKSTRIRYRGEFLRDVEKYYRVMLTSGAVRQDDVDVTVTQSLPLFVVPEAALRNASVSLISQDEGKLSLEIQNRGNSHFFVKAMRISGFGANGESTFAIEKPGWYLLPDKKVNYTANVSEDDCKKSSVVEVVVEFRDGTKKETQIQGFVRCAENANISTGFEGGAEKLSAPLPVQK